MQDRFKTISLCIIINIISFSSCVLADEQEHERILVKDNSNFAVDLYQKLCDLDGNIFFSPYSISTALSMTYAGARGNTEMEMAKALRFSLDQENLHPSFAKNELNLKKIQTTGNIKLSIANNLWPQQDYKFLDEYLSLVKKQYGVSITPVDYKRASEAARKMINQWVEEKTQDKIKDLIQPGILDALTQLVLVNAIYFKGNWETQFNTNKTTNAPFYVSHNKSVQAPIMSQKQKFLYAEIDNLQVLELPYEGNELSMIVLLPKKDAGIKHLETNLTVENLQRWKDHLRKREVRVSLPKFKMTSMFRLDKTLVSMGMVDAFSSRANFAGMDGTNRLYIGAVLHKAFVDVNEAGTEAAAATAIVMKRKTVSEPPPLFRADHPFIFLIQENRTGNILFIGRLIDPTMARE